MFPRRGVSFESTTHPRADVDGRSRSPFVPAGLLGELDLRCVLFHNQRRSKRSRFITLAHVFTNSPTHFSCPSARNSEFNPNIKSTGFAVHLTLPVAPIHSPVDTFALVDLANGQRRGVDLPRSSEQVRRSEDLEAVLGYT